MEWYTNKDVSGSGPCQLITALNALVYFEAPLPSKQVIEIIIDATMCRYGSALHIESGWSILGLHVKSSKNPNLNSLDWIKEQLNHNKPVEIGGFSPDWGYHSALCIEAKDQSIRLVNWEKTNITSMVRWDQIIRPECGKGPIAFYMDDRKRNLDLK